MPLFNVRHVTTYRYRRPVTFGEHRLLFRPRDSYDQTLLSTELVTDPPAARLRWIHDVFGNCVAIVSFDHKAAELRFETRIRLDHTPRPELVFDTAPEALRYPFDYPDEEAPDLAGTMRPHYPDDRVTRWARQFVRADGRTETGHLLMTMCFAIHEGFAYARRNAHGTQSPGRTLSLRRGTCRDFALLMMEGVRALGFAARFVSGYVYVPDRDGAEIKGGGSTHAWCEVYLPGAGWVEFDPTNGIVGNRDLIRVAVTRDPNQAVPLSGTYEGEARDFLEMEVGVTVTTEPGALEPIE
jgi:transglutaminase-like putative cysteine protease